METTIINPRNGIVYDNPNKKTYKVFSNKTNSFYYQDRDPEYYRNYYHDKKEKLECSCCGRMIYNHGMRRHQLSNICKKNAKIKLENDTLNNSD